MDTQKFSGQVPTGKRREYRIGEAVEKCDDEGQQDGDNHKSKRGMDGTKFRLRSIFRELQDLKWNGAPLGSLSGLRVRQDDIRALQGDGAPPLLRCYDEGRELPRQDIFHERGLSEDNVAKD